jgi:hypothetical protein
VKMSSISMFVKMSVKKIPARSSIYIELISCWVVYTFPPSLLSSQFDSLSLFSIIVFVYVN